MKNCPYRNRTDARATSACLSCKHCLPPQLRKDGNMCSLLDRSKCKILMTETIPVEFDEVEFGYFDDGNPFVAVNDQVIPIKEGVLTVYCIDWPEHLRQAPVRDVVEYLINKQQNYNI